MREQAGGGPGPSLESVEAVLGTPASRSGAGTTRGPRAQCTRAPGGGGPARRLCYDDGVTPSSRRSRSAPPPFGRSPSNPRPAPRLSARAHTSPNDADGGVEVDAHRLVRLSGRGTGRAHGGARPPGRPAALAPTRSGTRSSASERKTGRGRRLLLADAERGRGGPCGRGSTRRHTTPGPAPLHASYSRRRLVAATDPRQFRAVRRLISFGEYLGCSFYRELRASMSMARDRPLRPVGTALGSCSGLGSARRASVPSSTSTAVPGARLFTALAGAPGVPWLTALGDGACSSVGAGCTRPGGRR